MESGALGNPEATVAASTAPAAPPRDSIAVPAPSTASPLLSASEAQWDALAQRSENIFATQEWLSTWWRHFGASHESLVALERGIDGLPIAALPLYRSSRGPLRVLRFIGGGPSDQLGPVCAPADEVRAASSLRRYASSVPDWDLLLAEYLPGRRNWAHLLGGTETRRESSPTMSLTGLTWDGYLASRSSNFRQQVRRRERNLARGHDLSFRLADDPDRLHADLDTLFRLHRARWNGDGSGALNGSRAAFHREFAALALERGWLRLWFLELDGRPAAAWYGFRFAGVESFYQSGRDPALERESVGFVLLAHTIREAMNDGCREYRFLRGPEAYKSRFTITDEGLQNVVVANTARGRAALAAIPVKRAVRAGVGRVLRSSSEVLRAALKRPRGSARHST